MNLLNATMIRLGVIAATVRILPAPALHFHTGYLLTGWLWIWAAVLPAQNPIVPNRGLNDPHIHIFNDTAYVYASHDKSAENTQFIMEDWWVWSSPDLVQWTKRSVLNPEDTYIGAGFSGCWATDVGYKEGKYYWYFSERNKRSGVVVGPSPTGPWEDELGEPLLTSELTPTEEYDMAIFEENGDHYIVFGVWDYYIARLADDMMHLAEVPRKLVIHDPAGPYGPGKTDDKVYLHQKNGKYYLSWGCFYAVSERLYGPYEYVGATLTENSFAPGYASPTWPTGFQQGRHGSYFSWHGQDYFTYCDISQTGNRYFRDAFISYVHYRDDGTIAPLRVDGVGVGRHLADQGVIPAEEYFAITGAVKEQDADGGFRVRTTAERAELTFPHISDLANKDRVTLRVGSAEGGKFTVVLRRGGVTGPPIAERDFSLNPWSGNYEFVTAEVGGLDAEEEVHLSLETNGGELLFDGFTFSTSPTTLILDH